MSGNFSSDIWNPWHGCTKYSEGCEHCYVYRRDDSVGKDAREVTKNTAFDMPIRKKRNGEYKIPPGSHIFLCMTSDFFLDKADEWRSEIWDMVRIRSDVKFTIITKRILRVRECLPEDWGDGWENVRILVTMENQRRVDERLTELLSLPIKHKSIICEPLLSAIDFHGKLTKEIESITVGGESGNEARICDFAWVLSIREQCEKAGIGFGFKQTGAKFVRDGKLYRIKRQYQHLQAKKAGINIKSREETF